MEVTMAATSTWNNTAGCFQNFRKEIPRRRKLLTAEHGGRRSFAVTFSNNYRRLSAPCSAKSPIAASLKRSLSDPIKEFPWKKAESVFAHRLLELGKGALKWSLAALYITSFASDIFFSISQNRELVIPLGLFAGVTLADFFRETTRELLLKTQKEWSTDKHVVTIGAAFAAVKFVVVCSQLPWRIFLCHVCNGGLMQVLWLMKNGNVNVKDGEVQIATTSEDGLDNEVV